MQWPLVKSASLLLGRFSKSFVYFAATVPLPEAKGLTPLVFGSNLPMGAESDISNTHALFLSCLLRP